MTFKATLKRKNGLVEQMVFLDMMRDDDHALDEVCGFFEIQYPESWGGPRYFKFDDTLYYSDNKDFAPIELELEDIDN